MNAVKQYLFDGLQERIAKYQAQIEKLALLPDDLPGHLEAYDNFFGLDIPYDFKILVEVRQKLGHAWKFSASYIEHGAGRRWVNYTHKETGASLSVIMNPDREGATCRRVQTGTRRVPVYEVVCD